ncbi:hypothetical protein [Streptococcus uberis]|uniref:Hypothetical phage protein n=1 Tax=Streptococcus uberis (strain ATCC BAA-854 / 0140J) TaxID=218495 RepID=B9DWA5_STRU0|nr:hypothetical protein [Streptococcus uberis]QBX11942.1 hypothetical protein JavanS620_0002 [Streptococcus satellite phage Javan620]MCK1210982.1 hypothetical protein [Streptococcus uberis]MCK1216320.1 hypothetical protein [Streptococcus uberis]MCK1238482.1 hypothetical protein [Streptococcus uberis]MCR4252894.1 hypothetical protein [Streptococcus uberis]
MYNEEIAKMILSFEKDDCRPEGFDWDDFEVTAKQLIASGQIYASLKVDYLSPYVDFE